VVKASPLRFARDVSSGFLRDRAPVTAFPIESDVVVGGFAKAYHETNVLPIVLQSGLRSAVGFDSDSGSSKATSCGYQ